MSRFEAYSYFLIHIRIHTNFNIILILFIFKVWSTHHTDSKQYTSSCWYRLSMTQNLQIHTDLVLYNTYVVCVHFLYMSGGTYSLKSTPNDGLFEKLFMAVFIYSQFLPEICWEEIAEDILPVFCFDVWPEARTLALRLISQHAT